MKSLLKITAALVAGTALSATAATFNFEGTSLTTGITSLVQSDSGLTATFTRVGGLAFEIRDTGVGAFGSRSLAAFNDTSAGAFIVNFSALVSGVTVSMGDFAPSDSDTLSLVAYSGAGGTGSVLGSVTLPLIELGPAFNFLSLSVGSASIASITMNGGSAGFPNSVFYDNLIATTGVSTPDTGSTVTLLFAAIAGLGLLRRRLA